MTHGDAHGSGGHLTVQRSVNPGAKTGMAEVWELEHLAWYDGESDYDVLKVHYCDVNSVGSDGLPHGSGTMATCKFEDAPWPVRKAFVEQIRHVHSVADRLYDA